MRPLPEPETYEDGLDDWPYGKSLDRVLDLVCTRTPPNGRLLDIMCGPGTLLGRISEQRPDLTLVGVDIDQRYIEYGASQYPRVSFLHGDVLDWQTTELFDTVTCTGALHHVHYDVQGVAIANIATLMNANGLAVISDCYIDDYTEGDEIERRLAAAKLGHEYLHATIANGASDKVTSWTVDIIANDVLGHEFKTSIEKRLPKFRASFLELKAEKIWPQGRGRSFGYGDYIHLCSHPKA